MRTLDFMVWNLNHHKLFGVALQEMLRRVNNNAACGRPSNQYGSVTRPPAISI